MTRVAVYVRVSTEEQAQLSYSSLDSQIDRAQYFVKAKENDWQMVLVYREEGVSGATIAKRKVLRKMLSDAQKGLFDVLVTTDVDRLTRNLRDFYTIMDIFNASNVSFIAMNQNFDTTTPFGKASLNLLLVFAEFEREMTSLRTKQKRESQAKRGKWCGGLVPFGYNVADGKLVVNEKEAEALKLAVKLYIETASPTHVARKLNKLGFRKKQFTSRRGKLVGGNPFTKKYVSYLLQNPLYTGMVSYKGTLYAGEHAPIVSGDVQKKIMEIMKKNKQVKKSIEQNKHELLLLGLIKCGHCKSRMSTSFPKKESGKIYLYYQCTKVADTGRMACEVRKVPAREIENVIVGKISELAQNEKLLSNALKDAHVTYEEETAPLEEKRACLEKQLQDTRQEMRRIITLLKTQDHPLEIAKSLMTELKNLEDAEESLAKEVEMLAVKIHAGRNHFYDVGTLQQTYRSFNEVFEKLDFRRKKKLLELMIQDVVYTENEVKLSLWELPEIGLTSPDNSGNMGIIMGGGSCTPFGEPQTVVQKIIKSASIHNELSDTFPSAYSALTFRHCYGKLCTHEENGAK